MGWFGKKRIIKKKRKRKCLPHLNEEKKMNFFYLIGKDSISEPKIKEE